MTTRANPDDQVQRFTLPARVRSPGSPSVFAVTVRTRREAPLADPQAQAFRDDQWTTFARRLAGMQALP